MAVQATFAIQTSAASDQIVAGTSPQRSKFQKFDGHQRNPKEHETLKFNVISLKSHPRFAGRARYYDAYSGRFLQTDPDPGKLTLPISTVNRYVYAGNNPSNFSDPTGRSFWKTFARIAISLATIAVSAFLPVISVAILGNILTGAIAGAIGGVLNAKLSGTDLLAGAGTGAIMGAVTGAAAGFGGYIGESIGRWYGGFAGLGAGLFSGAVIGAVGFGLAGYDPAQGAIAGAIAGGIAGALAGFEANSWASGLANAGQAFAQGATLLVICAIATVVAGYLIYKYIDKTSSEERKEATPPGKTNDDSEGSGEDKGNGNGQNSCGKGSVASFVFGKSFVFV